MRIRADYPGSHLYYKIYTLHNKETRLVENGGCVDLTNVKELLGHKSLQDNMGDTGLEPVTPCLSSKCSSQLS